MMPFSTAICSELNNPAFGTVSLTGRTIGSTATYMCNPGYNLVGNVTRTCEQLAVDTADWSDAPPTCQRMYEHDSCIVVLKKSMAIVILIFL